jgi:hypothetical protein
MNEVLCIVKTVLVVFYTTDHMLYGVQYVVLNKLIQVDHNVG